MITFKQFFTEQQNVDIIDNQDGLGSVPDNQNIDYLGLRVRMFPTKFIELAQSIGQTERKSLEHLVTHLQQGGKIGAPFLNVEIPKQWTAKDQPLDNPDMEQLRQIQKRNPPHATVTGHEGRHRMIAVQRIFGDVPIEVHMKFRGEEHEIRNRHITDQWIKRLKHMIKSEDGDLVLNPIHEVIT